MPTKYPIVLVHGIAAKKMSFGKITKVLKNSGYTVYKSKVDCFGNTETNSLQLKKEVLKIMEAENCDRVNIIGHSKGGLDAKRMITELDMENSVASYTTLCTPHKGSPMATQILTLPSPVLAVVNFTINTWFKICGDKKPNAIAVCKELALAPDFDAPLPPLSDKIYCQSYSSTLESPYDDILMGIPLRFCRRYEDKVTDGLVSQESAAFGVYKGDCLDHSFSHAQVADFWVKRKDKQKLYDFYLALCAELAEMGF